MKDIFKLFILVFSLCLFLLNTGCAERRILSTCFYDCSDVVERRIPIILSDAPGVKKIKRLWTDCESEKKCVCYESLYKGDINDLASWVQNKIRNTSVRSFRLEPKGDDRLEVHFNWDYNEF